MRNSTFAWRRPFPFWNVPQIFNQGNRLDNAVLSTKQKHQNAGGNVFNKVHFSVFRSVQRFACNLHKRARLRRGVSRPAHGCNVAMETHRWNWLTVSSMAPPIQILPINFQKKQQELQSKWVRIWLFQIRPFPRGGGKESGAVTWQGHVTRSAPCSPHSIRVPPVAPPSPRCLSIRHCIPRQYQRQLPISAGNGAGGKGGGAGRGWLGNRSLSHRCFDFAIDKFECRSLNSPTAARWPPFNQFELTPHK